MSESITFTVNGAAQTVATDPDRSLLEVLREDLHLTGTKYGCGEGQCGACTVLADGKAIRACLTSVKSVAEKKILTIEGLGSHTTDRSNKTNASDQMHPVQQAFAAEDAFQCGFCTPGMILELVDLLERKPIPADSEILAQMEGHLCRCCGYPKLIKAIKRAASDARNAV